MTIRPRWQVEKTGCTEPTWLVVLRWGKGAQQELARDDVGRIIWFRSPVAAEEHAATLNARHP